MPQIIFDFSELITDCLHDEEIKFTNAIVQKLDSKKTISELFKGFKFVCQKELKELLEMNHSHLVKSRYVKEKIERLVDNPYLDYNKLCQVPLGQEPRLYGNLQKIKHTNLYLFKALVLDPNHLIYNEQKYTKLKILTCLFNEVDKCQEIMVPKSKKRKK